VKSDPSRRAEEARGTPSLVDQQLDPLAGSSLAAGVVRLGPTATAAAHRHRVLRVVVGELREHSPRGG
jgi:hypothetical protein